MKMIISADLHLREDKPRCRNDINWIETQEKALKQLVKICIKKQSDLYLIGDIFHRSSEFKMVRLIQKLADRLYENELKLFYLCGNHDMLYHSSENIDKSAIGLLGGSRHCMTISNYFNVILNDNSISASNFDQEDNKNAEIVFKHILTMLEKNPMFDSETPETLVKKFPNARYIFTGDYHKNFCKKVNDAYVINPGCLLRQASDMKDYQCGVYYVDTDDEEIEFIPIIDIGDVIDDSYLTKEKEREERIEKFANKLKDTNSVSLDFISNVQKQLKINNFDDELKNTIQELLED